MSFDTKYRPLKFQDVVGQQDTVEVLQELLKRGEVFQKSYVFAGPSGTGKTTTARILARAMLCSNLNTKTYEPCNECPSCKEILTRGATFSFTEMDAANNTGADNVRRIIEGLEYFTLDGGDRKIYLIDECFTGDTEILTEEGLKTIRTIVETKYSGKVLSYDTEEAVPVWEHVTDWFDIPDEREVLKLTFDNEVAIEVTLDQEIYTTNRGWVVAKDLTEEDDVCDVNLRDIMLPVDGSGGVFCMCGCGFKLTPFDSRKRPRSFIKAHSGRIARPRRLDREARGAEWEAKAREWNSNAPPCACGCGLSLHRTAKQLQYPYAIEYIIGHRNRKSEVHTLTCDELEIIYGTLLGDTSITRPHSKSYPRLAFTHSLAQEPYAVHKAAALSRLSWRLRPQISMGYKKGGHMVLGNCSTLSCLEDVWAVTRPSGPKSITNAWLDCLSLKSLAYWYMDDGSIRRSLYTGAVSCITLHTEGFSEAENQKLAGFLSDLGYPTRVSSSRGYYFLYLPRKSATQFIEDIDPFIHESMSYKSADGGVHG